MIKCQAVAECKSNAKYVVTCARWAYPINCCEIHLKLHYHYWGDTITATLIGDNKMNELPELYYNAMTHLKKLQKEKDDATKALEEQREVIQRIELTLKKSVGKNIPIKNFVIHGKLIRVEFSPAAETVKVTMEELQ